MRSRFGILVIGLAITALIACGKDDKSNDRPVSVNADGNCTEAFIQDINAVSTAYNNLRTHRTPEAKAEFIAACDQFLSRHKGVQCKARSEQTGQVTTADANTVAQGCDNLR